MAVRSLAVLILCLVAAGCENVVARGDGGSEDGVDNLELGITF